MEGTLKHHNMDPVVSKVGANTAWEQCVTW